MWRLSPYRDLLKIGKSRRGAIYLDIGSCGKNRHLSIFLKILTYFFITIVGNDARKLVADGFPLDQIVTSDLRQGDFFAIWVIDWGKTSLLTSFVLPEFSGIGHNLFRTSQETYPIAFVPGDVFDPKHLEVVPPLASAHAASTGSPEDPTPDLCNLISLNPLHGRVFAIHASSFFHLFSEEKQLYVARALAGLLSPEPGSVIFGMHVGSAEKGFIVSPMPGELCMFCHSSESWTELWDGVIFEKGLVNVQAELVQMGKEEQSTMFTVLVWTVTRL